MRVYLATIALFISFSLIAQGKTGNIRGTVKDKNTQELLIGVAVVLEGSTIGATTDIDGRFVISNIPTGSYNVKASLIGYKPQVKFNINVTSGNDQIINFELEEDSRQLKEIEITYDRGVVASPVDMITPLSVQSLTTEEIRSNPGGNFDISRVVQVLPGVAGSPGAAFRNDIIIRGGAPNENVYYLDGIEIPVINHFQTQGASGGPAGILNVSFIEDVKLSSSAFDARFDNALASVFQFKQREGNPERVSGNFRTSSSEVALTLEGPAGKKTNYLVSARRSYLQLLFELIDLPIRPNYWDFQYKVSHKIDEKTTLNFIGVGAIDEFTFGEVRNSTPENSFIIGSTPSINQWNYTTGVSLRRLVKDGYVNVALSRNMFDNKIDRFENKDEGNEASRILKIRSQEIENKLRIDVNKFKNGWKYSYGVMAQYVKFNNSIFNRISTEIKDSLGNIVRPALIIDYDGNLNFLKYGAFAQLSRRFFDERFLVSFGLRNDMNSFTDGGNNPLATLSPRISFSYALTEKWNLNASVGRYFKIPPYTVLGFQDSLGLFVNQNVDYIRSDHFVIGTEFLPNQSLRFTVEGFLKLYGNYPVSLLNGISLANQGGGFDVLGNEPVLSNGLGEVYGFEVYAQQKLVKNYFAVLSYTFYNSRFSGFDGELLPSAWDYRHLFSGLLGRKFNKGWEMGLKYRFAGGAPFTPFDPVASQLNFPTAGVGVLDFSQLNSQRLINFNQFDVRFDKKINFKRATLDLFIDVINAFGFANPNFPNYTFKRTPDNSNFQTTDGQALRPDGSNGIPVILQDQSSLVTPTIGFIFEF
jgi:hypothetical protein